ncbi:MAG TPA: low-specificity L-threonine aldolase [Anaerolineales bacterium]|nr:low-specificity L-threonine aldolase [Anaerolineales bacterium]
MKPIDLRSDTVTTPSEEMREVMRAAPVGDDVYLDDPTVNRLQDLSAEMTGFEAGLFVASGTMGNLVSILAQCARGDEIICGKNSHVFLYEGGSVSSFGGIHSSQVTENSDGSLPLDAVRDLIRVEDDHHPETRLIAIETTHNERGGVIQDLDFFSKTRSLADEHGLKVHLDGARLFNAAVEKGVKASAFTKYADSVTFCLSKGLGAPIGSVICGQADFIKRARKIRKHLGGGMRQAGIIAAAGIYALENLIDRLVDDHRRAKMLADGLRGLPGIKLDPDIPPTNMVFFDLLPECPLSVDEIHAGLKTRGILTSSVNEKRYRLVTHLQVSDQDIEETIAAMRQVLNV